MASPLLMQRAFSRIRWLFIVPIQMEGEERFIGVGLGSAGQMLVVVYTMRGQNIRLISVRRATKREVKDYEG